VSLRDSIASLASGTYTVTRTEAGARVQGRYTPGPSTTFEIVASIQPATGRQLRDLPEGQRGDETVAIYTVTELRTRHPGSPGNEPDLVTYRGEPWTVTQVKRWESFGEVHFECLAVRAPDPKGVVP
jgi:hypothetical protein